MPSPPHGSDVVRITEYNISPEVKTIFLFAPEGSEKISEVSGTVTRRYSERLLIFIALKTNEKHFVVYFYFIDTYQKTPGGLKQRGRYLHPIIMKFA